MSHFYSVFYNMLPDCKPYTCPICDKCYRDRSTLARHYAFTHNMIFELTNLTPTDLQGIIRPRVLKENGAVVKCFKCGLCFNGKSMARKHVLSHYHQVFYNVLPDCKPFACPICGKFHRDRTTLTRHYALLHKKVFEMTDLTPEALHFQNLEPNVFKKKQKFGKKKRTT